MPADTLARLSATIRSRASAQGDTSYTRQLLESGTAKIARKFGEEAIETIVAALGEDTAALTSETADVLYHLLVLLESRGVAFEDVLKELDRRQGTSGLDEKAARTKS